ncbi:hypothetical protein niasHS_016734 [Heterodera schachtii]|uniref:Uncharacterized protein n=1 Tax=Heterodera schachtii TaxID=97005 RepID=A0ABD2I0Y4_HETSC
MEAQFNKKHNTHERIFKVRDKVLFINYRDNKKFWKPIRFSTLRSVVKHRKLQNKVKWSAITPPRAPKKVRFADEQPQHHEQQSKKSKFKKHRI